MTLATTVRRKIRLGLGTSGSPVGELVYVRQGRREHSAFAYDPTWMAREARFSVSADLPLGMGYQTHKAISPSDSVFHGAIADTEPDAWGRRVIARDHAKRRKSDSSLAALTELDYLLAVDDFSRVGALRLRDDDSDDWLRTTLAGQRSTPALIELERIYQASRAVENGRETAEDLRYLLGKGTSLGGMRPKCSVLDESGFLAIGKFPSVGDTRSVTRGEVLAMKLAAAARIRVAEAKIVVLSGIPVAVIRRFDRVEGDGRLPYQSAASMLQASRDEDRSYFELADAIRTVCKSPIDDLHELWRRIVFNLLITNVDDHLKNHGFIHVSRGLWRLAPAFDLNPFPDKDRESKTWLSEQDGPITDLRALMSQASYFALTQPQALAILAEVHAAVSAWWQLASGADVGLQANERDDFAPAFEHEQMTLAAQLLRSA